MEENVEFDGYGIYCADCGRELGPYPTVEEKEKAWQIHIKSNHQIIPLNSKDDQYAEQYVKQFDPTHLAVKAKFDLFGSS